MKVVKSTIQVILSHGTTVWRWWEHYPICCLVGRAQQCKGKVNSLVIKSFSSKICEHLGVYIPTAWLDRGISCTCHFEKTVSFPSF
jgi:hypothetical protein